jgi:hypothetical protein
MKRIGIILMALFLFTLPAEAAPSYKSTLSSAKSLRKSELKLAKAISSLSTADREKLKKALAAVGLDSDKDGVSDIFERARGSGVCDADSDDDGIEDHKDGYENDDNKMGEVEAKGPVVSFTDPTLVVGTKTFTVTGTTTFRRGVSSKADLAVGACIKVEGYTNASNVTIATKIEKYARCSGGSDDDNDSGSDDKGEDDK